ncbi:MAG: thiol peroxidase [Candidatus Brocadiia bacterium]
MAEKQQGTVTLEGNPVTLSGTQPQVGDEAPGFTVVDAEWNEVHLSDYAGKVILISAVPSVDTSVCSLQTQRFNEEAGDLPDNVVVLTISQDLPFALGRFCGAEGVDRIPVLSDHVYAEFGDCYGILIEGMRLLARSIWLVDEQSNIAYKELVPEITDHPDYEAALEAAREVAGR